MEVTAGASGIVVDGGRVAAFATGTHRLDVEYSAFSLSGHILEPHEFTTVGDGTLEFVRSGLPGEAPGGVAKGTIQVAADRERLALSCQTGTDQTDEAASTRDLGLVLRFDLATKFHLAEPFNVVRLLDSDMPAGREYTAKNGPSLCIVETAEASIALWADDGTEYQRLNKAARSVSRHPECFSLRFSVPADQRILISVQESITEALQAYRSWIVDDLCLAPRQARPDSPRWVDEVQLFFIVDMLRSTGEITHDYADLEHLTDDLAAIGCPKNTVFYIPGWNGPYDAAYPEYRPRVELGGDAAFRSMMDTVHHHEFRVMIHTNPWGLDPFHPQIDELLKYALKDKEGRYAGFQTHSATKWGQWAPEFRTLDYTSGRLPLSPSTFGGRQVFIVPDVPDCCEAVVTVGGMPNFDGRLAIQFDERVVRSPERWFTNHDEYTFPFALRLGPGENQIRIDGPKEALEADGTWFRAHDCRVPVDPYATWTYPILFGDTSNDEWNQLVISNIAKTVERYSIDAIHCDATNYQVNGDYYKALRRRLPTTAIGAEGYSAMSSLGYFECQDSIEMSPVWTRLKCPLPAGIMPTALRLAPPSLVVG